ncbi:MAG: sensor histidine kinase, partial [Candidatus Acidiferrum sp.]
MKFWTGRAVLAALAWTLIGVVFALPNLSTGRAWRPSLLGSLAQWWSWGLVTPLILAFDRRLPFSDAQLPRRIAAHLLPSLLFTAAYIYVFAAVLALLRLQGWNVLRHAAFLGNALRGMFLWSVLVYWLIFGVSQAFQYRDRYLSSELRMERLERR